VSLPARSGDTARATLSSDLRGGSLCRYPRNAVTAGYDARAATQLSSSTATGTSPTEPGIYLPPACFSIAACSPIFDRQVREDQAKTEVPVPVFDPGWESHPRANASQFLGKDLTQHVADLVAEVSRRRVVRVE
jgi:hypothetical protein